MDAKVPVALKATLSQSPDTVQHARTGMSAYDRLMSSRTRESQLLRSAVGGIASWLESLRSPGERIGAPILSADDGVGQSFVALFRRWVMPRSRVLV
jgi:hypothetical protein